MWLIYFKEKQYISSHIKNVIYLLASKALATFLVEFCKNYKIDWNYPLLRFVK